MIKVKRILDENKLYADLSKLDLLAVQLSDAKKQIDEVIADLEAAQESVFQNIKEIEVNIL